MGNSCCRRNDGVENNQNTMITPTIKPIEIISGLKAKGSAGDLLDAKARDPNIEFTSNLENQSVNTVVVIDEETIKKRKKKIDIIKRRMRGHFFRLKMRKEYAQKLRFESEEILKNILSKVECQFEKSFPIFDKSKAEEFATKNKHKEIKKEELKQEEIKHEDIITQQEIIKQEDAKQEIPLESLFDSFLVDYAKDGNINSAYKGHLNINMNKHGYGISKSKTSIYEGVWQNNTLSGFARHIDEQGTLYEGIFYNNKLSGEGIKLKQNADTYKGKFIDNFLNGIGIQDTNDFRYEGEFKNDNKEGHGKYIFKQLGESYEGESRDNDITGIGKYVWSNGNYFEGTFVKGKMHGKGKYAWPDGGEYIGDYVDNVKHGKGVFKWADGKLYEGDFIEGRMEGSGILTKKGIQFDVIFEDGKVVKKSPHKKV